MKDLHRVTKSMLSYKSLVHCIGHIIVGYETVTAVGLTVDQSGVLQGVRALDGPVEASLDSAAFPLG